MFVAKYHCRFHENILTDAYTNELIKDSEKQKISEFWESDIMDNLSLDDLNYLNKNGFEWEVLDSDKIKITKWPLLKIMHLLICKNNPKKWMYQDENGDFMFSYVIDLDGNTFSY